MLNLMIAAVGLASAILGVIHIRVGNRKAALLTITAAGVAAVVVLFDL
jgi:hypothetical protein